MKRERLFNHLAEKMLSGISEVRNVPEVSTTELLLGRPNFVWVRSNSEQQSIFNLTPLLKSKKVLQTFASTPNLVAQADCTQPRPTFIERHLTMKSLRILTTRYLAKKALVRISKSSLTAKIGNVKMWK